jgi:hypothetical protein
LVLFVLVLVAVNSSRHAATSRKMLTRITSPRLGDSPKWPSAFGAVPNMTLPWPPPQRRSICAISLKMFDFSAMPAAAFWFAADRHAATGTSAAT